MICALEVTPSRARPCDTKAMIARSRPHRHRHRHRHRKARCRSGHTVIGPRANAIRAYEPCGEPDLTGRRLGAESPERSTARLVLKRPNVALVESELRHRVKVHNTKPDVGHGRSNGSCQVGGFGSLSCQLERCRNYDFSWEIALG